MWKYCAFFLTFNLEETKTLEWLWLPDIMHFSPSSPQNFQYASMKCFHLYIMHYPGGKSFFSSLCFFGNTNMQQWNIFFFFFLNYFSWENNIYIFSSHPIFKWLRLWSDYHFPISYLFLLYPHEIFNL